MHILVFLPFDTRCIQSGSDMIASLGHIVVFIYQEVQSFCLRSSYHSGSNLSLAIIPGSDYSLCLIEYGGYIIFGTDCINLAV